VIAPTHGLEPLVDRRLGAREAARVDDANRRLHLDAPLLLRALEVYETHRIDFAEAYLVASAESACVNEIASFDRSIDRVATVNRIEP
jgi:predicted nucleic acid-binding protein